MFKNKIKMFSNLCSFFLEKLFKLCSYLEGERFFLHFYNGLHCTVLPTKEEHTHSKVLWVVCLMHIFIFKGNLKKIILSLHKIWKGSGVVRTWTQLQTSKD